MSGSPKSAGTAYLCWFFGLHYLYLEQPGLWLLFWVSLGGFGFWMLIDLFRIPSLVADFNRRARMAAAREENPRDYLGRVSPVTTVPRFTSERGPYEMDATPKQLEYLWDLGFRDCAILDRLGKHQASELIAQLRRPAESTAPRKPAQPGALPWFAAAATILLVFWIASASRELRRPSTASAAPFTPTATPRATAPATPLQLILSTKYGTGHSSVPVR